MAGANPTASAQLPLRDDLRPDYLVQHLAEREPGVPIGVVGFSVGANICLKWLGESGRWGETLPVVAAVGVSVPFNLGAVAKKIKRGFSRIYQWYLLRSLRRDVERKMEALGDDLGISRRELRRLNTFFSFDDRISGPWNGFSGAEDYYARTQSDLLLKHVAVPTLILNASNDPLVPVPPDPAPARSLRQGDAGGHPRRRPSWICLEAAGPGRRGSGWRPASRISFRRSSAGARAADRRAVCRTNWG